MKFGKFKLAFLLLLVMTMIVSSLAGCGKKSETLGVDSEYVMDSVLNPLGSDTICKEKVELEFMLAQSGNVIDYNTNKYTVQLEKKGNVDIKFTLLPVADAESKINLMLSSGKDLPDVLIRSMQTANVATYGEAGIFIPLNEYYENSSEYLMPQIKKYKDETGTDLLKYITMSDGNIYCVPSFCETIMNEMPAVLWVYTPWLEKSGMEAPKTFEEFEKMLKYFKENDMNGNIKRKGGQI